MLTREAKFFVEVIATCERVAAVVDLGGNSLGGKLTDKVENETQRRAAAHLDRLEALLDGMGVRATMASVRRLKVKVQDGVTYKDFGPLNQDIFDRFKDEMEGRHILFMDDEELGFFAPEKPLFGELVADRLPSCSFDIEEAGKCYGVARYTACLFHLMRAAESASAALAKHLGAATENEHGEQLPLGILTANIDAKIKEMPKGKKKDDWLKVPYVLHACNRAYRTKTAHPADVYTGEEAERAIQATRALLQEFADLLPDFIDQLIG